MARSATDATRFTSTTPHAATNPKPVSRNPGPPGETPQQRVKRLRAAADRARDAQTSTFDKLIMRGRVWADRAHRFTAFSLIGITFIAGGVTVYALGDMMVYNRKKRAEFFAEQKFKYAMALQSAQEAAAFGSATESQTEFLKREQEREDKVKMVAEAKKNKSGPWKKSKEWLFSGLKKEEEGDDVGTSERRLGYEALSEEDDGFGARESDVLRAIEEKKMAIKDKTKSALEAEKERQRKGGPLDRMGTEGEEEKPKSGASANNPGSNALGFVEYRDQCAKAFCLKISRSYQRNKTLEIYQEKHRPAEDQHNNNPGESFILLSLGTHDCAEVKRPLL
ncbi:hypothetical protein SBOR_3346 [Sclerotinia borealis F-4128]|uniref:Cytochrome oxidase c assembly domain-containing protein n=1 Tax=Sclerotinia borealis (strain F-4128) TaxID=1432307 RepID=W9CKD6_SCLBF|nr:hypothetical protein SBOR_3346 [Sclerotinia borealis F-4128]